MQKNGRLKEPALKLIKLPLSLEASNQPTIITSAENPVDNLVNLLLGKGLYDAADSA